MTDKKRTDQKRTDQKRTDQTRPDPKSIVRRSFLKGGALGAAAGLASCAPGAGGPAVHATRRVRWQLASSFPRTLDTIYGAAEVLCDVIAAMSDGNFQIRPYEAGELVPGLEVLDAVQRRAVQVGQTGGYYYIGKNPALAFDTCLPFGLTAREQSAWLEEAGGLELMRARYADFDVISFPGGNTGAQMGGWFREPIRGLDDLKGLKMRIPGLGGRVMDALGVSVQVLAGPDIYPALERGAIDATEWVGPYDDLKLGFPEIAKHYYYPGWWEPGPALSFLVNKSAWDELPSSYQAMFDAASRRGALAMQTRYDAKNPAALKQIEARGDVTIAPFTRELLDGARKASEELMDAEAAADPGYREILEHWRAFRREAHRWFGTAELAYQNYAFGDRR